VVLGPAVSRLAASYVALPLDVNVGQVLLVAGALLLLALAAAALTGRRLEREPVVAGLGSD